MSTMSAAILLGLMFGAFVGVCVLAARERDRERDEEARAARAVLMERMRTANGYGPRHNTPTDTMILERI